MARTTKPTRLPWGTIKKLKSGRFRAAEPLGNGKHRGAPDTFRTRKEAESWLRSREQQFKEGKIVLTDAGDRTFKSFYDRWLAVRYKRMMADPPTLTVKSYQDYESPGRNYLIPLFGDQIMSQIDDKVIEDLQQKLNKVVQGKRVVPPRPAQKCEKMASWICAYAVREGALASNPFKSENIVRNNKKFKREWHDITSDQVEICAKACTHNSLAVYLGSYVGLRAGEVWGLKMNSVHIATKRIQIAFSFTEVTDRYLRDDMRIRKGVRCGLPKPQREKNLDFPPFLIPMIEAHLRMRKAQGAKADDWLFVDRNGLPVSHTTWYNSHLKPAMTAAGMHKGDDFHTLRHFCGSWYLHRGYPPFIVRRMLDHTEAQMTDHYSHLMAGEASAWHEKANATYETERAAQTEKERREVLLGQRKAAS